MASQISEIYEAMPPLEEVHLLRLNCANIQYTVFFFFLSGIFGFTSRDTIYT